jgi:microcystin-dependent protein
MKISQLNELTSADDNDCVPIVDDSEDETKYITKHNLVGGFPVGSILMYGGSSAPDGWLLCDGNDVSRNTYSELFAAIGETFGIGDGSTTFNLPDLRGRSPIGGGQGSGLTNRSLGESGGEEEHQLIDSEIPEHGLHRDYTGGTSGFTSGSNSMSKSVGGDQPHNTMHPFIVINFMIKY